MDVDPFSYLASPKSHLFLPCLTMAEGDSRGHTVIRCLGLWVRAFGLFWGSRMEERARKKKGGGLENYR